MSWDKLAKELNAFLAYESILLYKQPGVRCIIEKIITKLLRRDVLNATGL